MRFQVFVQYVHRHRSQIFILFQPKHVNHLEDKGYFFDKSDSSITPAHHIISMKWIDEHIQVIFLELYNREFLILAPSLIF